MTTQLDKLFATHGAAFSVRNQRAQVLASNIANADTPGYQARDVDFRAALQAAQSRGDEAAPARLLRTSARHLTGTMELGAASGAVLYRAVSQASIDDNTVDVNLERAQFADNAMRQEATLMFINGKIKSLLAAIQS
ncbi:MAG: flagellar basal body rod protein FlgB [Gammaproteobacteria bacterium]|nr:flagellar basal body rod protein FlgB [Gammaproteobacteria bacterium]